MEATSRQPLAFLVITAIRFPAAATCAPISAVTLFSAHEIIKGYKYAFFSNACDEGCSDMETQADVIPGGILVTPLPPHLHVSVLCWARSSSSFFHPFWKFSCKGLSSDVYLYNLKVRTYLRWLKLSSFWNSAITILSVPAVAVFVSWHF